MHTCRGILPFLVLVSLSACEVSDSGFLAVTWRFNGHAAEGGANPCGAVGANRVVIELDGPEQFSDVVSCDNVDPDYPLLWLGFVADLPVKAYGRLLRSVPAGKYDVRIFFIDAAGNRTLDPPELARRVTIEREEISRIDLDFSVTTGAINTRWRIAGRSPSASVCETIGASHILLQAHEAGGGALAGETLSPCAVTAGAGIAGLEPGTYDISGQLLDSGGDPITEIQEISGLTVDVLGVTAASLGFPWASFDPPLYGNLGFFLAYDEEDTLCSEVTGLAHAPIRTRMGLADSLGQAVTGLVAYSNPGGELACAGLTAAQAVDGVTLAPCLDDALLLCDLEAGDYELTVEAADASDMVCFGAAVEVEVTPLPPEEPFAVVLTSYDASACWE
ncbi:MAG: hypothetical protein RBU30_22130 [Polyangia bacterium]|jgi:hypothetical protein|nr:hypothetical protein [Polyangia bacterium]